MPIDLLAFLYIYAIWRKDVVFLAINSVVHRMMVGNTYQMKLGSWTMLNGDKTLFPVITFLRTVFISLHLQCFLISRFNCIKKELYAHMSL